MADPDVAGMVAAKRSEDLPATEPNLDEDRTIIRRGNSLYVNLTFAASSIVGFEPGQQVSISTYDSGVWVEPVGDSIEGEDR